MPNDYIEFDNDHKEPSTNWFKRTSLFSIHLAGIGMVAYKMGGPTGKILDKLKEQQLEATAEDSYKKWTRQRTSVNFISDFQGKIETGLPGEKNIIKSSVIPTIEELASYGQEVYGIGKLTPSSSINYAERLENDIQSFLEGDVDGHSIDSLKKMDVFHGHGFTHATGQPELSRDMIVTKLKYETLKEHVGRAKHIEGAPKIDITDPTISEDPFSRKGEVDKLHRFYMENDKSYADAYVSDVKRTVRDLRGKTVPTVLSRPDSNLIAKADKSVQDLVRSVGKVTGIMPDHSAILYANATSVPLSREVVEENLQKAIDKTDMRVRYQQYTPQLKKLAGSLERLKSMHLDDVSEVFIKDVQYGMSDQIQRKWLIAGIRIKYQGKPKLVQLRIPVAEDGIVPNMSSIHGRVHADIKYITGQPHRVSDSKAVNVTQNYIEQVDRMINDVRIHSLFEESPLLWEYKRNSELINIQGKGTPLYGEKRDFIRANQIRFMDYEQLFNTTAPRRQAQIETLKIGVQSIEALRRLKRGPKDYKLIALDLETINLDAKSVQFQSTDPNTGIWQFGMVESDSNGKIINAERATSDHILNEHGLFIDELKGKGKLRQVLSEQTPRGDRLRGFASFCKKLSGKTDDYEALTEFMQHVKKESNLSRQAMSNTHKSSIKTSVDFANYIKSRLVDAKQRAAKEGKKAIFVTANGALFDLQMLSTLTGDQSIKRLADNIDVQSYTKAMTTGMYDAPPMNVSSLLSHYMNKKGTMGKDIVSFEHDPTGAIRVLSEGKILTMGAGNRRTALEYLQGKLNNKVIAHDALADSFATLGIAQMMKDTHDATDYFLLDSINEGIAKMEGFNQKKNLESYLNQEGMVLPDELGSASFGLMSAGQSAKHIAANLSAVHMYPLLASNPPGRNLSQLGRNIWIRKDTVNTKNTGWMSRHKLQSHFELKQEQWMHKEADWYGNYLDNKMKSMYVGGIHLNTAYMPRRWGGKEGLNEITRDALGFTAVSMELVPLRDIPQEAQITTGLLDMYRRIDTEAAAMAKDQGISLKDNGGKVTAKIWNDAAEKVKVSMETRGGFPRIDPNNPITMTSMEGGTKRVFKSTYPGKIVSIVQDTMPGSDKGPVQFLARVMFEASGENLNTAILNDLSTKSVMTPLMVKSTDLAYGKFGLSKPIQRWTNYDFLDKRMWGSLRYSMLQKAFTWAHEIIDNPKYDEKESRGAKKAMSKLASLLKSNVGAEITGDGSIVYGPKSKRADPMKLLMGQANITTNEILNLYSTIGHDLTWDKKRMEAWYGWWGSDMWEGRTKIKAEINTMIKNVTSKISDSTSQVAMYEQQQALIEHLDPIQYAEKYLKQRHLLKGQTIEQYYKSNPGQMETLINQAKIPIYMQLTVDPHDPTGLGKPAYIGPSSPTFSSIKHWEAPSYKKYIKIKKSNFDQFMLKGNHVPQSTKEMLMETVGWKKFPKLHEVADKFRKMQDALTNKTLSKKFTDKHSMSYDEITQLISRTDTIKAIERDLTYLNEGGNPNAVSKVSQALDNIKEHFDEFSDFEYDEAVVQGAELTNIKGIKDKLETIRQRPNWMHINEIKNQWSKMGTQKDHLFFLPAEFKKYENGEWNTYGKRFQGNLETLIDEINIAHRSRDPINKENMVSILKQIQEGHTIKGAKSTERLFNITKVKDKHVIDMAGLILPADKSAENIAHKIMGDYGVGADGTKAVREAMEAYRMYQDEALAGRRIDGRSTEAIKKWIQTLYYSMVPNKSSAVFAANNTSFPQGAFLTYKSADSITAEAMNVMQQLDGGSLQPSLTEWFGKNKSWANASGRKNLKTALNNIINMKYNTSVVSSEVFFNKDATAQLVNGGAINVARMVGESQGAMKDFFSRVKLGQETMPGGTIIRYPIAPEGTIPGHSGPILSMPSAIGELLGMDANKLYMYELLGKSIGGDTDGDKVASIMKGFKTIDEMKRFRIEDKAIMDKYLTLPNFKEHIDEFNSAEHPMRSYYKNGVPFVDIAQIDSEGRMVPIKKRTSDLKLHDWMEELTSDKLFPYIQVGNSSKAAARHLQTNAVGAWSKTQIGLWNNTVTQRVHEVFMANPGLAKNSPEMFALMGTLTHGLGAVIQEPAISPVKHGSIEMAYEMSEMYKVWNDPNSATFESYKKAKDWWISKYKDLPDKKYAEKYAAPAFDFIMNQSRALDKAKQYDPTLAKFFKNETGNLLGRSGFNFLDWVQYSMSGEREFVDQKVTEVFKHALESTQRTDKINMHGFSDFIKSEYLNKTLEKEAKFRPIIPRMNFPMKKAGKIGAMAAAAYIGLNFFRPVQMSNSANPLDLFVDLGTDINGRQNIIESELELPRHMPLDMVNASFSKEAFYEMNSNRNHYKEAKSNYLQSILSNSTLGGYYQENMHEFKSKAKSSYSNRTKNIGPFGTRDLERRSQFI